MRPYLEMVYRIVGALLSRAIDLLYREPGLDAVATALVTTYLTVSPTAPLPWAALWAPPTTYVLCPRRPAQVNRY